MPSANASSIGPAAASQAAQYAETVAWSSGNTAGLKNAMQVGRSSGMISLERSLKELVDEGKITEETAAAARDA